MRLDKNGDSEGNFSVLALKKVSPSEAKVTKDFMCDYQMVPVGQFLQEDYPVSESDKFFYFLLSKSQCIFLKKILAI